MKKLLLFLVIFCLVGSLSGLNEKRESKVETGTLLVLVKGFKSTEGQLMVALFNKSEDFPDKKPYKGNITAISANEELIKFEDLPYGDYAISALHDINLDGKLDKNAFGIPTEGYGFSNNVMDKYGPPSFLQASFVFFGNDEAKVIELEYGIPKK
jgi:uncharacterized protein (DUF2141 family)